MFDCGSPVLVFVTQTHHPVLEHHTGYIFAYYEFAYHKAKEMFFTNIYEAQLFVLHRGGHVEMNPERKPETVTAMDYILSAEDDSRFMRMETGSGSQTAQTAQTWVNGTRQPAVADIPEPDDIATVDEIEWFGE